MNAVIADFAAAAKRVDEAGFDMVELHMAHGYLLSSFISPVMNKRDDEYSGSIENRMRFPLEVLDAVRAVFPDHKPVSVRVSATDWRDDGLTEEELVALARMLKDHGCDVIDVSAGQTSTEAEPEYGRMFQTPFAERIRLEAGLPTIAVGAITTGDQVNTIVAAGRSDLCAMARPHLADPYATLHEAAHYGFKPQAWPVQYLAGKAQVETLAERENDEQTELRDAAKPPRPEDLLKAAE